MFVNYFELIIDLVEKKVNRQKVNQAKFTDLVANRRLKTGKEEEIKGSL